MRKILFLLILVILLTGCSADTFKVKFFSHSSSSGGDRDYNFIYTVVDSEIVSCEGTYSYPPSSEQQKQGKYENNIEQCDVEKLKNGNYDVKLITKMPLSKTEKGGFGPFSYNWEILPIDEMPLNASLIFSYSLSAPVCSPCTEIKIYDTLDVTIFKYQDKKQKKTVISEPQLYLLRAEMKNADFFNAEIKTDCPAGGGAETVYYTDEINEREVSSTCGVDIPNSVKKILDSF